MVFIPPETRALGVQMRAAPVWEEARRGFAAPFKSSTREHRAGAWARRYKHSRPSERGTNSDTSHYPVFASLRHRVIK